MAAVFDQLRNLVVLLALVSSVFCQEGEGINFCAESKCFCDIQLTPIEIDCSHLHLKSIWEDTDWNATLKALNLTGSELLTVNFEDNDIEHIPRLPALNIAMLSFQKNKIKTIEPFAFTNLEVLETLNLAENELRADALAEEIFYGKQPENSTSGSGYFPLPILHLNLSSNKIHSIPKYAFDHFPKLRTLDLGDNPLRTLAGNSRSAIGELLKLEYLGLKATEISDLPDGLLHELINLVSLDLSNNRLEDVPKELSNAHKLEILTLDGNLFKTLWEDSFTNLNFLKDLSISYVYTLRQIEEFAFTPLKNLTKLTLTHNPHLAEINDGAFEKLVEDENATDSQWSLTEIYLNDNGLTYLDQSLLPWTKLDYIDIQNNPFHCDCNLAWMVHDLMDQILLNHESLTAEIRCSEPKEMKGRAIKELTKEPDLFKRCSSFKGRTAGLSPDSSESEDSDGVGSAGITVLVIGIVLIAIALSILGFIALKRRAITQALMTPSQIRYERAETEDGSEWRYHQPSTISK